MFAEQMLPRSCERLATIKAAAPVKAAADLMSMPHTDLLVVCGDNCGKVGVLPRTDVVGQIGQCVGSGCTSKVDTIMTREVASCRRNESLEDIWSMMKSRGLQRIPILDETAKPVGIIYARDVLQCLLSGAKSDEALLRDCVMGVGYQ